MFRSAGSALSLLLLLVAGCGDDDVTATGAAAAGGGAGGDGTRVTTDKGPVQGAIAGETRIFLGIPFAAPPVGDLRWKPPQPAEPWSEVRSATERGAACPQLGPISPTYVDASKEDCLTLNVWAPKKAAAAPAPVLVWIHGGTFIIGSGGEAAYDGQLLSEATGAVVVTINYRLGPLGFLGHAALKAEDPAYPSAGMYGFEDQRAALAWTRDNIAAFGGDAKNVTLFGESAGGISTCDHLVSPKSDGLFHRAIIESGACATGASTSTSEAAAQSHGDKLAKQLGCDSGDVLACMRGKSPEELLLALPASATDLTGEGWGPVVDGWNLPDDPTKLLGTGKVAHVPTLLGTNANEGTLFFAFGDPVTDDASYLALIESVAPGKGEAIVGHYPIADFDSPKAAAAEALADAAFVCPARRTARALAKAGIPTYLYHFTYVPGDALLMDLGSFHSSELPFVFGNPMQLLPKSPTADEAPLVHTMMGYWGRMSAKGDPNGAGAVEWPKYDASADESIRLDLEVSKQAGVKKADCDFWDAL